MKIYPFLLILLTSSFVIGQHSVIEVSNPKENGNGYVSNPSQILTADDVGLIDNICAQIELEDSFQVVFVVLESIGSEVPKDFATELFNTWKIGHVGRDDGLLVLFVMDQRRIEFETGYGTESVLTDYACVRIQEDFMIEHFKIGDYAQGLLAGAEAIQNSLRGQVVSHFLVQELEEQKRQIEYNQALAESQRTRSFIVTLVVWHAIGLILFLIALLIARFRLDPYDKYNAIKYFGVWIWAILFPLTHIFVVLIAKSLKQRYRDMIRFSGRSGEIMRKLNEQDEDAYLSTGQLTEELVKSVDYDVWTTDGSDDLLVLTYHPLFTKYSTCPKCHFKTYYKVYDRQINAPTYSSSGSGERKHECANCKHVDLKKYTIPRLQRATSSSSSIGWSSSNGGGGSFGGGSSGGGGGGSFGGGSSGGGGGGSSW